MIRTLDLPDALVPEPVDQEIPDQEVLVAREVPQEDARQHLERAVSLRQNVVRARSRPPGSNRRLRAGNDVYLPRRRSSLESPRRSGEAWRFSSREADRSHARSAAWVWSIRAPRRMRRGGDAAGKRTEQRSILQPGVGDRRAPGSPRKKPAAEQRDDVVVGRVSRRAAPRGSRRNGAACRAASSCDWVSKPSSCSRPRSRRLGTAARRSKRGTHSRASSSQPCQCSSNWSSTSAGRLQVSCSPADRRARGSGSCDLEDDARLHEPMGGRKPAPQNDRTTTPENALRVPPPGSVHLPVAVTTSRSRKSRSKSMVGPDTQRSSPAGPAGACSSHASRLATSGRVRIPRASCGAAPPRQRTADLANVR